MKMLLMLAMLLTACGGTKAPSGQPPQVLPQYPDDNDPTCLQGKTVGYNGAVSQLINDKCTSCHPAYENYENVSKPALGNQIVDRINLPTNDVRRMPKFPEAELSFAEKKLLRDWQVDGFKLEAECKDPGNINSQAFMDLNAIERYVNADLDSIQSDIGQANARYLIMSHKANAKAQKEDFLKFVMGMNKGINTLSSNQNLIKLTPVDPSETVYRMELASFGLTPGDWNLILSKDPFKFESRTRRGLEIQRKTRTQYPWLHADNFNFIALGDPGVYNQLIRISSTLTQEQQKLRVDQAQQFRDFEARLIGFNGSPISENKNRLLLRMSADNNDSSFWQTFDPNAVFSAQKNLSEFPLVVVGQKRFLFDASETIAFNENGMMRFGLWNSAGAVQTEAPQNVVVNNRNPFSSIIKNGLDCLRCHNSGLLQAVDQIRSHVNSNPTEFPAGDFDLVNVLYKSPATNTALFLNDNKRYQDALRKLGIDPNAEDPVNIFLDDYRTDLNLEKAAGFVFMTPSDFCTALQVSGQGRAQVGQLCTSPPGTVTLTQWQATFPILRRDLRLGLDPLGN